METNLALLVKREGRWSKKGKIIFRQEGSVFLASGLSVCLATDLIECVFEAKLMDADEIYWKVMGMEENTGEPLSFRAWGAFTCSAIEISSYTLDDSKSPGVIAKEFLDWSQREAKTFPKNFEDGEFSKLYQNNEHYIARGAYAEGYVASLLAENKQEQAIEVAKKHLSGELPTTGTTARDGLSFFERVIEWDRTGGCFSVGLAPADLPSSMAFEARELLGRPGTLALLQFLVARGGGTFRGGAAQLSGDHYDEFDSIDCIFPLPGYTRDGCDDIFEANDNFQSRNAVLSEDFVVFANDQYSSCLMMHKDSGEIYGAYWKDLCSAIPEDLTWLDKSFAQFLERLDI